jgi:phage terminase large subunit-like protein
MTEQEPTKVCTRCKEEKLLSEFNKDKWAKDGLTRACRSCAKAYNDSHKADAELRYQVNKEAIAARNKAWRANNKSRMDEYHREYRAAHKKAIAERNGAYYEAHRDRLLCSQNAYVKLHSVRLLAYREGRLAETAAAGKAYGKAHPDKIRAKAAKRRAAQLNATPAWFEKEAIEAIYAEAIFRSNSEGRIYHVDHIVPLVSKKVCGLHCLANLQILPGVENIRKGNRHWPDMP